MSVPISPDDECEWCGRKRSEDIAAGWGDDEHWGLFYDEAKQSNFWVCNICLIDHADRSED